MAPRKPAPPPVAEPADRPADLATLGGRLHYARKVLRDVPVKPLSLAAGLSTSAAFQIEDNPDRDVRVGTVLALARELDVNPAWLAFGMEPVQPFPAALRGKPPAKGR